MDDLKAIALTLCSNKKSLIDEIKIALRSLDSVNEELQRVKVDAVNLKKFSKEIDNEFIRIETKYFQKESSR
jgi:hypothetical protein